MQMSTSTLLKINTAMIYQICPRGIVSLVKFMNRLVLVNVAILCILGMYSDYLVSLLIKLVRLALSFISIIVNERNLISHLLRLGHTQTDIAKVIGVYPSTICRELRRGEVELLNSDKWIYYKTYSPQKAQMQADYMKTAHGPDLKIGNRRDYLAALEAYMLTGSSPEDAISKVGDDYGIRISKTTCYRYIKMRLFPSLCYKHLPQGHPKKGKGQVHRSNVAHPGHRSIERRAHAIRTRQAPFHWEIDSVVGKAEGKSESCLVMTERTTRAEIVLKVKDKTAGETVKALQRLKREIGRDWYMIFKTLTCDNGPEFADQAGIDALGVTTFYCHPQAPHERGTNEVTNKLVRRKLPKGKSMAKVTQKQATEVQHWVNHYTRPMFGGKSAADKLRAELDKLPLYNRAKVYRFFDL